MVKVVEEVPVKGIFDAWIYRHGKLIDEIHDSNLIVNGARFQMAHLLAGDVAQRNVSKIAFGTSGTDPAPADTIITNQYSRAIVDFDFPENGRVRFNWDLPITENNGMAILEFGLLTVDGTLFSRKTRSNPIYKESDISIEGQWTIIF